jgi:hypothetical protein
LALCRISGGSRDNGAHLQRQWVKIQALAGSNAAAMGDPTGEADKKRSEARFLTVVSCCNFMVRDDHSDAGLLARTLRHLPDGRGRGVAPDVRLSFISGLRAPARSGISDARVKCGDAMRGQPCLGPRKAVRFNASGLSSASALVLPSFARFTIVQVVQKRNLAPKARVPDECRIIVYDSRISLAGASPNPFSVFAGLVDKNRGQCSSGQHAASRRSRKGREFPAVRAFDKQGTTTVTYPSSLDAPLTGRSSTRFFHPQLKPILSAG